MSHLIKIYAVCKSGYFRLCYRRVKADFNRWSFKSRFIISGGARVNALLDANAAIWLDLSDSPDNFNMSLIKCHWLSYT